MLLLMCNACWKRKGLILRCRCANKKEVSELEQGFYRSEKEWNTEY